jgi:hypothetical protein
MTRAVRWQLVGTCLLFGLAGCARMWFAEREPWRREAEISCLKSGAVKEGSSIAIIKAIEGPGACGADYPLRVAALGDSAPIGFADEPVRPPGAIQAAPDYPRSPQVAPPAAAPSTPAYPAAPPYTPGQTYAVPPVTARGMPLSLAPPLRSTPPDLYARQRAPIRGPVEQVPVGRPAGTPITARPAAVSPAATLACPLVSMLDRFVSDSVQPAAARWFGQPVVEIKQISAYSCRGMNGDSSARISEHAFGNALDIAAFTLADGRTITVKDGWNGAPEEQGFLHDVQSAACTMFTTVLAPGSNVYHYDHMHVDLMRRSSGYVICEPAVIPGEAAFARAGGRYGRAQLAETPNTGSSAMHRYPRPATGQPTDRPDAQGRRLPSAVAGED